MLETHPDSSTVDVSIAAGRPGNTVTHHPDHQRLLTFDLDCVALAAVGLSGGRALHLLLLGGQFQPLPGLFGRGDLGEEAVGHRTLTRRRRQPRLRPVAQREHVDDGAGDLADGAEGVWWRGANSVGGVCQQVGDVGDGRELSGRLAAHHVTQQAPQVGDSAPLVAPRNRGRASEERRADSGGGGGGGTSRVLPPAKPLLAGFHRVEAFESIADFRRHDEFSELLQAAVGHRGGE